MLPTAVATICSATQFFIFHRSFLHFLAISNSSFIGTMVFFHGAFQLRVVGSEFLCCKEMIRKAYFKKVEKDKLLIDRRLGEGILGYWEHSEIRTYLRHAPFSFSLRYRTIQSGGRKNEVL